MNTYYAPEYPGKTCPVCHEPVDTCSGLLVTAGTPYYPAEYECVADQYGEGTAILAHDNASGNRCPVGADNDESVNGDHCLECDRIAEGPDPDDMYDAWRDSQYDAPNWVLAAENAY